MMQPYSTTIGKNSQRMLDITDDVATRYHINFGKEKKPSTNTRENANRTAIQT